MAETKGNIIMFPFMAQGHIIPFLALAIHIEKTTRGSCAITFINTPKNINNLRSSLPPNSSIHLLEIPFDSSDHPHLPPSVENCDALPYHLVVQLLQASLSLKPVFRELMAEKIKAENGRRPLCVIGDIFFGWMASVARELGVLHFVFSGAGAFGLACYYSIWTNLPRLKVAGDDEFTLPDFQEASRIHRTQLPPSMLEADGSDTWSVFQNKNLPEWVNSDGILFNSVEEFDGIGMLYFKRKLGLPVWSVGPICLPEKNRARAGNETGTISPELCKKWLDQKPVNSALYISFGSMNTISATQMIQLAMALESSGKNFIWVVRPPVGFDINSDFNAEKWLPEGFSERIRKSGRGLLVHKWAPQVEILSHRSTAAFLSHCGWNSVLESLSHGVPLLGWAMAGEQFFNVKFLVEEVGVCMEVARGKTCEVKEDEIAEKIKLVMDDTEKGKDLRRKTEKLKKTIMAATKVDENGWRGASVKAMDEFLNAALTRKKVKEG